MGEVAELVTGLNRHLMSAGFVLISLALQIFVPYHRYVFFLKWLTLSLLAYAAVLFTVHVPWGEVLLRTFWPKIGIDSNTAAVVVAIFGTTISPMKALSWSAVINGMVAVPLLVVIMLLASKASVMGQHVATPSLKILGWLTTVVMGFATLWLFIPG